MAASRPKKRPRREPSSAPEAAPPAARDDAPRAAPTGAIPRPAPDRPPLTVHLRIHRQDGPERVETRRIEEYEVSADARMTVAGALASLTERPVTRAGETVSPVAWESGCVDVGCGACVLLIDGRPRPACGTLLTTVVRRGRPLTLAPLTKFPLVRDLVVDRGRATESLLEVGAWLADDGDRHAAAPRPRAPGVETVRAALGRCTSCAACLEVCPEYGPHTDYVGPAAINRVRFVVEHAEGALTRARRVSALMRPGGLADCGKAESCVEACPIGIPLVDSLQVMNRAATRELVLGWLLG